MSKHVRYGGSSIHRTMACPGSATLIATLPKESLVTSEAAKQGSALHEVFEALINKQPIPSLEGVTLDLIAEKITPAIAAVDELFDAYGIEEFETEAYVEHPSNPDIGGSIDLIGSGPDCVLVIDYKSGDGALIDAENNKQLLFYAALARRSPNLRDMFEGKKNAVVLAIIQPTDRREEVSNIHAVNIAVLEAFEQEVLTAIARVQSEPNTFSTGEHCRFCPALAICPAKQGVLDRSLRFDPTSANIQVLSAALEQVDDILDWCHAVKDLAHQQLEAGTTIPGWKLVAKRAMRKWIDPDALIQKLRRSKKLTMSEYLKTEVLSPAQLEKLCKQKLVNFDQFAQHMESVSSGTTLAREEDPRPAAITVQALRRLSDRIIN